MAQAREPAVLLILRIVQLAIAICILGIAAYLTSQVYGYMPYQAISLSLANSVLTLVFVGLHVAKRLVQSLQQNPVAWILSISLDALMIVLWLSAMGSNAALAVAWGVSSSYCSSYSYYSYGDCGVNIWGALTGALAGLSAIELILVIVTLCLSANYYNKNKEAMKSANFPKSIETPNYQMTPVSQSMQPIQQAQHMQYQAPVSQVMLSPTQQQNPVFSPQNYVQQPQPIPVANSRSISGTSQAYELPTSQNHPTSISPVLGSVELNGNSRVQSIMRQETPVSAFAPSPELSNAAPQAAR